MALRDRFKEKGKKIAVALALGGALLGIGYSLENSKQVKAVKANIEHTMGNQNTIQQEINYFSDYVRDVESGKDKMLAYDEFMIKMTGGNVQKMADMQKKLEKLQEDQQKTRDFLLFCLVAGAFLMLKKDFCFDFNFKSITPKKDDNAPYKRSNIGFHTKN